MIQTSLPDLPPSLVMYFFAQKRKQTVELFFGPGTWQRHVPSATS